MTATVFVDTNVLVYRRDATDPRKQEAATAWLDIVSAAQTAACSFLLSEDLQTGQEFNGVKVISPFSTEVAEVFPQRV